MVKPDNTKSLRFIRYPAARICVVLRPKFTWLIALLPYLVTPSGTSILSFPIGTTAGGISGILLQFPFIVRATADKPVSTFIRCGDVFALSFKAFTHFSKVPPPVSGSVTLYLLAIADMLT
jgi:hypothetical protein